MKRPLLVLLTSILLCLCLSVTSELGIQETCLLQDTPSISQEMFGMNFITPTDGEVLSGNITIKLNATVLHGIPLLLRWNNDSWIDIADRYNGTSKFYEYPMDVTCLATGNITFEAKQDTGHGVIYTSVEATIKWYRPPILVVCDYGDANITDYYTNALEALGFSEGTGYSTWYTLTNGSPATSDLLDYQFVIWFKGGDPSPISSGERDAIATYLYDSSMRKMILTGTEIAWRAYNGGGYEGWLSFNFGVNDYIGDGSNTENILGSIGTPYFGTNYSYGGGNGSQMSGWADWLRTLDSSQGLFEYASSGYDEYAATMSPFVSGLLFGFAFDAISTAADRIDLMNRTLNYFGIYDPPQVNIISPSEGELSKSPVSLSWESVSDIPSLLYNPTFKIFVDGQLVIEDWPLETYLLPTTDGNHTIRIICEDNCGQRAYDSVSLDIDATLPKNEIINHPAGSILKSGSILVFNITDVRLETVVSRWDTDMWTPFPYPYQTYLPAGDGVHIFHVNSTDTVGNWNYTQFSLICDDTLPEMTLTTHNNGSSMMSGTNIELEINDTNLDTVTYHWDLNDSTSFILEYVTSIPSSEGVHDLHVNATDIAGNQQIAHYQFFTDDTAPVISLLNISNYAILKTGAQLNFQILDVHFDSVTWSWDSADAAYYDVPTFTLYVPAVEGAHELIINATDEAGNSNSISYQFVIDNTVPEIVLSSPAEGIPITGGTTISIDVIDLHLSSVHFRWDLEEWTEWITPYVTSAPMDDGYHSLFIQAVDEAGNWIQVVFIFKIDNGLDNGTTTPSTTIGLPVDLPTSLGLLGIGVGVGAGLSIIIFQILTRRKSKSVTPT